MVSQQDRIEDKLNKIFKIQGELVTQVALINQRCKAHNKSITALDIDVNGNGKEGLKQRVHDHDQALKRIQDIGTFSKPIAQKLITAAIVIVIAGAWTLYQDHRFQSMAQQFSSQPDPNSP